MFSDIDPDDHEPDLPPPRSPTAVHGAPRRASPVSLAGLPIDLEPLQEARRNGVVVIEDACHALGGLRGRRAGRRRRAADMTMFSFHPVKAPDQRRGRDGDDR